LRDEDRSWVPGRVSNEILKTCHSACPDPECSLNIKITKNKKARKRSFSVHCLKPRLSEKH
jgi:hypothetical protein